MTKPDTRSLGSNKNKLNYGCLIYFSFYICVFLYVLLVNKFTSVDKLERNYIIEKYEGLNNIRDIDQKTLADYLYEQSKVEYRVGARCKDGMISSAIGSGACSHHGGVAYWIYETYYRKTYDECIYEAKKIKFECRMKAYEISWIDDIESIFE